jgi:tripartite-type tricarboxylate transporter receptor subunit TctC
MVAPTVTRTLAGRTPPSATSGRPSAAKKATREDAMRAFRLATCAFAVAFAYLGSPVRAQDYPAREIHAICMFPPGTGADILVRFYAAKLQEVIGKPVVVENKAGAQGTIATEAVARAKPDGYTIAITPGSSTLAMAAHIFKKLNYDPVKDFDPVAPLLSLSFVLTVDPKRNLRSMADLTAFLKSKDAKGFYGGASNTGIVSAELYLRSIGVTSQNVAFRSPGDMLNAMTNGDIDFASVDALWTVGQEKEGRVRALAVTGSRRTGAMPHVPTLTEEGFRDIVIEPWWAVYVPAGTPQPVVDKLRSAFESINTMRDTKAFLTRGAMDPLSGTPETLRTLLLSDLRKWAEYVKLAKIEPQ